MKQSPKDDLKTYEGMLDEIKKGLLEGRWIVQNKQSISQPSFISTNVIDGEVSVEFDN